MAGTTSVARGGLGFGVLAASTSTRGLEPPSRPAPGAAECERHRRSVGGGRVGAWGGGVQGRGGISATLFHLNTRSLSSAGGGGSWAATHRPLVSRGCPGAKPRAGGQGEPVLSDAHSQPAGWPKSKLYFIRSRDSAGFERCAGGGTHWGGGRKWAPRAIHQSGGTERPGRGGGCGLSPAG